MQRHRALAAAPIRDTSQTWAVFAGLVEATLQRSDAIEASDVEVALQAASGVGRLLIAGGHLEQTPIIVVAGSMRLKVQTVSGTAATTLEENLNPVPGCASASEWAIYLPEVEPLVKLIKKAANENPNLRSGEPPEEDQIEASSARVELDRGALRDWARGGP